MRVAVGGKVTWVNRDQDGQHTAETDRTDQDKNAWEEKTDFDTHALSWDERYPVRFHKPGRYEYHCSFHPEMRGVVTVEAKLPPKLLE